MDYVFTLSWFPVGCFPAILCRLIMKTATICLLFLLCISVCVADEVFDKITLKNGQVLRNAEVYDVTPVDLKIRYTTNGSVSSLRIKLQDLPPMLKEKYPYDQDRAEQYYGKLIDLADKKRKVEESQTAAAKRTEARARRASATAEPGEDEAAPAGIESVPAIPEPVQPRVVTHDDADEFERDIQRSENRFAKLRLAPLKKAAHSRISKGQSRDARLSHSKKLQGF